jgi:hypothetical protein
MKVRVLSAESSFLVKIGGKKLCNFSDTQFFNCDEFVLLLNLKIN